MNRSSRACPIDLLVPNKLYETANHWREAEIEIEFHKPISDTVIYGPSTFSITKFLKIYTY